MVVVDIKQNRKLRIKWFRLAVLFTVGYCLYIFVNQQLEPNAIKREEALNQTRVEMFKQTNSALAEEKALLQTNEYVEKIAREELGLAKPGEVPYVSGGKK